MIIKKLVSLFIVLVLLINPTSVFADEMSISGNGEGSSSNVNIQSFATNTVEQNNQLILIQEKTRPLIIQEVTQI